MYKKSIDFFAGNLAFLAFCMKTGPSLYTIIHISPGTGSAICKIPRFYEKYEVDCRPGTWFFFVQIANLSICNPSPRPIRPPGLPPSSPLPIGRDSPPAFRLYCFSHRMLPPENKVWMRFSSILFLIYMIYYSQVFRQSLFISVLYHRKASGCKR